MSGLEPESVGDAIGRVIPDALPEQPPPAGLVEQAPAGFTAPEKLTSVVRAVLAKPSANHTVGMLLGFLTNPLGRRLVVQPMLSLLPPLDDPEAWDAWLAILVGCGLELASDGVDLDLVEARGQAHALLQALFDEAAG